MCQAITKKSKTKCLRSAVKNGYCKQHWQAEQIKMYKKELAKMHDRVRFYSAKSRAIYDQIDLIQRLDYIKLELIKIGGTDRAFKYIVSDITYRDELEDLFQAPFHEIALIYKNMLNRRNSICHKYSSQFWTHERPTEKISHNSRTVKSAN